MKTISIDRLTVKLEDEDLVYKQSVPLSVANPCFYVRDGEEIYVANQIFTNGSREQFESQPFLLSRYIGSHAKFKEDEWQPFKILKSEIKTKLERRLK